MVFLIINSMGWPIYQVQPGSCNITEALPDSSGAMACSSKTV